MRGITTWVGLACAIVLPACFAASISRAADMVPWVNDLATAQQMAAARNQLILIHFTSDNCPPCRRLENNVFNRPGFGHGVVQNYVPVRVNVTVSPDLARKFNVDRWPTDLLLTSRGEEIHRMISPQDLNDYLRVLNQVAWRVNTVPRGAPIQQASQGFHSDRQSAQAGAASPSPYQFVSQTAENASVNRSPRNGFQASNQPLPQYVLNDSPQGISYGPAIMNSADPNTQGSQDTINQSGFQPGMPQQYGMANPSYASPGPVLSDQQPPSASANNLAQQQIALAQRQVAMAQQNASSPQVVENRFAISQPARPTTNTPAATNSPLINAPLINPPATSASGSQLQSTSNAPHDVTRFTPPSSNSTSQIASGPTLSAPVLSSPNPLMAASAPQAAAPRQSTQAITPQSQPGAAIGLEGFCPVTLIDQDRWVQGDKRWGARHRGRLYLFQSAAAQQKFLAAADQYSPALAGFDPVVFAERGHYAEGLRTHGIRYQDQVYMFVSEESLSRFAESPTRYTEIVRQAIGANRQLR